MRAGFGRSVAATILAAATLLVLVGPARSQIIEQRQGDANPMVSVFKSTIYGGLAGLLVGGAIELVKDDADGEALKWGFVVGTFLGLGYGIYHVSTRPSPFGFLEGGRDGWKLAVPTAEVRARGPEEQARDAGAEPERSLALRASITTYRF